MTIASMTGYARVEGQAEGGYSWIWEAKSVNGRGLEVRVRLPHGLDRLEAQVKEQAAACLKRGNVQVGLTLTREAGTVPARINMDLLRQLAGVAQDLAADFPAIQPAAWDGLLAVKGVVETSDGQGDDREEDLARRDDRLRDGLIRLFASLSSMRQAEGGRIAQVLLGQLERIEDLSHRAGQCAGLRLEAVQERLRNQLAALLDQRAGISEDRLAQEMALLAVKADVREELDRLAAHIQAAREMISQGGAVGRKLDFLCQEFNREANTLCSKSQDTELTRIGLDLKTTIDQFREQVQNIE